MSTASWMTPWLNRHPRLRALAHRSADRGLATVARVGLDLNRLRVRVGDDLPQAARMRLTPLRPPELVSVAPTQAAYDLEPAGFSALCARTASGYTRPADGLLELEGGRFELPGGFISVGGRLPSETIPLLYFPHGYNLLPALRSLYGRAQSVPDGVLISLPMGASYYHWLCEVLPRALLAVEQVPDLPLYVGAEMPPFVTESLDRFGLLERCVRLPHGVYTAQRLLAVTWERAEWPVPADLRRVRDELRAALGLSDAGARTESGRRILISRSDAVERRIVNEPALLAALAEQGFERVTLSDMSLEAQVRLFDRAEAVVASHGAGLTNILFAPPGCRVLEITVETHFSPSYHIIASLLDHHYGYVRGEERARDVWVDPQAVIAVLDALAS